MDNVTIREINAKDKDVFVSLINNYVEAYIPTENVYPVKFDPQIGLVYWEEVTNKNSRFVVLIAELDDKPCGLCIAEIHLFGRIEKVYFEGDKRGEVWDIYVADYARGRGIGKKLITMMEEKLLNDGCNNVVLNSVGIHNEGAKKLYENLGYKAWNIKYFKRIE